MRRLKRALALLLTLSLLVSVMTFPANAAEEFTVSVDSGEVNHGETIKLDVSIDNNTDLSALTVYVYYKANLLTCTDANASNSASGTNDTIWYQHMIANLGKAFNEANPDDTTNIPEERAEDGWKMASFGYVSNATGGFTTASGIIGSLTFTVADDVESCETPIEVEVVKATNSSNQDIVSAATNGTLTINGVTPTLNEVTLAQNTVNVAGGNAEAQTVQATATSVKGTNITTGVTWSVDPADKGVTVDADSGVVSVGAKATAGEYTITATPNTTDSQGDAKSATLTVTRAPAAAVSVSVADGSSQAASTVTVQGANAPDDATVELTATVTDQYGEENAALAATAQWTVATEDGKEGDVTVSGGTVTVDAYAAAGTYTITAAVGGQSDSYTLTVEREVSAAKTVKIYDASGVEVTAATLAIPASDSKDYTFTARVFDQFGSSDEVNQSVTWKLTSADAGITSDGGKVTVASTTADEATATLTAKAADNVTASVSLTARTLSVNWDQVTVAESGTYGDTNASFVTLPEGGNGTASAAGGETINGTYSVKDAETTQDTGEQHITVVFTVAEGEYAGEYTRDYTVQIAQRTAELSWSGYEDLVYDGQNKNVTATVTNLVGEDECTVIVTGGDQKNAGDSYTATAQSLSNANYKLPETGTTQTYSIAPKTLTVEWSNTTLTYNGQAQKPTAAVTTGVDGDTVTLTVTGEQTNAGDSYTATAAMETPNGNYTLTGTETSFEIKPATVTIGTTAQSVSKSIKADAAENTDAAALKTFMDLPAEVEISGAGTVTSASITWADATEAYNVKGSTYTYVGTLDANANFVNQPTLTATLKVSAVNATLTLGTTAATKTMGEIDAAEAYEAFLPTEITVDYDNDVDDTTYAITDWDKTLDELKAVDASAKDVTLTLTPTFDAPAWATLGATPTFDLTITSKYPVTVSFTTVPTSITYGQTLTAPVAEQTTLGHGTDDDAEFVYTYVGTKADGTAYNSTEAPKDAGTYTVTAELDSDTHSGKATSEAFTIAKKEVTLAWSGYESLVYDGTAKNVTATISAEQLVGDDVCTVTVTGGQETNAGSYTATATALSNPNYALPETKTQAYTIAKADRNLTVDPTSLLLYPGSLTAQITASTDTDADKSAVITYKSANTTGVTVNAAGKVTAVANGTATITVAIAATDNYNAVSKTVSVKALVQPLTGVSISSSEPDDLVTAVIENGKIVVSGIMTNGATLTITPTAATVDGMNITAASDGTNVTVKVDNTVVATYPIDTTAVVTMPANVDVTESTPVTSVGAGIDEADKNNITTALGNASTKVEGLAAAGITTGIVDAAQAALGSGKDAAGNELDSKYDGVEIQMYAKIEAVSYSDDDSATASFRLSITPSYKVVAVDQDDPDTPEVVLIAETKLATISGDVQVSVKLPDNFPTTNLFARHYLTGGGTETLRVNVTDSGSDKVATWTQSSFSEVELFADARRGSITYTFADGHTQTVAYDAADVGNALPTDTKDGFTFQGWTIDGKTYTTLAPELLTAINGKTLNATGSFKENTIPGGGGGGGSVISTFVITASAGEGGTISPTGRVSVNLNANKQFTIKAKDGYVIADVLVDGVSVGAVSSYTFERVNKNHTISVTFKEAEAVDVADIFWDISTSTWCYDAVQFVYVNGLMNGTTTTTFEPNRTLNRGMWVTMLYRMAGSPAISGTEDFTDVDASTWCYDALLWASRNGIVNGFDDGTFRANAVVTRQQLVAILYRYAQYMGYDTSASATLEGFVDASAVWAVEPMQWALAEGVLAGTSATTLSPNGSANRGQAATFLMRFMNNVA